MDKISPASRSANMRRIGGKNTEPELVVRRVLRKMGIRYKLHLKGLPGTPDIIMNRRRIALFVHGCFWHRHSCRRAFQPASHSEFWSLKFSQNVNRDTRVQNELKSKGWQVLVIWECETKDAQILLQRLSRSVLSSDKDAAGCP